MQERLIEEVAVVGDGRGPGKSRPARPITVNRAESPLGWLHSRQLVTDRQYAAGDQLRSDWERSQLAPSVTMRWSAAPSGHDRKRPPSALDLYASQVDARRRFDDAVKAAGPGLADILW